MRRNPLVGMLACFILVIFTEKKQGWGPVIIKLAAKLKGRATQLEACVVTYGHLKIIW